MKKTKDKFYSKVNEHIHTANKQSDSVTNEENEIASSLLYAGARYSAFLCAINAQNGASELKVKKEEAIKLLTKTFKDMLTENMDDYIDNFKKYTD